jgi:membrane protein YdbS with pleckstrin-like domain
MTGSRSSPLQAFELKRLLVLEGSSVKNHDVAEQALWRGSSSQWKNAVTFGICLFIAIAILVIALIASQSPPLKMAAPFILILLIVPIAVALARYLQTKTKVYELTNERLKITEGVFSKVSDTLELYRVKDLETRQPFSSRLCRLEDVQLNTSDASTPFVIIDAVPTRLGLGDKIRNAVEAIRQQKRVREIDIE